MLVGERRTAAVRESADNGDRSEPEARREQEPVSWIAAPEPAGTAHRDRTSAGTGMPMAPGGLVVGSTSDPEEARADRVADSVMQALRRESAAAAPSAHDPVADPAPVAVLHRSAGSETSAVIGREGGTLDAGLSDEVASHLGGGSPIPAPLRRSMEGAFGRNLGDVRVHTNPRAARLSQQIAARAFSVGRDVFFGKGEYQPGTADGQRVLAHELAHTVRGGAKAHRVFGMGESKKSDEEKLAEDRKKEVKRQNEQKVKASGAAMSVETDRLKEERKKGKKARSGVAASIAGDRETTTITMDVADETGTVTTKAFQGVERQSGTTKMGLDERFQDHLHRESLMRTRLVRRGVLEEEAADRAYQQVWMNSTDDEIRAVRPPRETAAERLVSEVTKFRTGAGNRQNMNASAERGTLLPKAMEELYERFVVVFDSEVKAGKSESDAELTAASTVWTTENLKGLSDRPKTGSPLDLQARDDARRRVRVMGAPEGEKGLDKLSAIGQKVQGGFDTVAPVLNLVSAVTNAGGLNQSVDMRNADSAAAGFAGNDYMEYKSGNTSEGNQATELLANVGGADIQQIMQTHQQVELGVKRVDLGAVSNSTTTLVGQGFGAVTSMLGDIISGANGAIVFVKAVQKAHSTGDPHDIAAAARVGADALASFNSSAKSASTFATVLNPDVTTAVAHVVPGLDIAAAALGIISGTMSMVGTGMRVQSTQLALNSAHLAMTGGRPNVLIYPLLRVEQSYVKTLEQNTWSTIKAVSDLGASIAQLATAGGYGVPAAYKAATNLLTLLHNVGHMIADDVLTRLAKKSQQHSTAVLEGSAEERLQRDPAMAVDGIIVAAINRNAIAQLFLSNFTVGTERIDSTMLGKMTPNAAAPGDETLFLKIRAVLLDSMGNDVDPTYTYEKFAQSAGSVIGSVKKHTVDKFAKTGELAEGRNNQDAVSGVDGDRGLGWRMKMMFTREHQLERKLKGLAAQQRFGPAGPLDDGMWCRCGTEQLPKNPTDAQKRWFQGVIEAASDEVLRKSMADPANPREWQDLYFDELQHRVRRIADVKAKGKVSVG